MVNQQATPPSPLTAALEGIFSHVTAHIQYAYI